VHIFLRTGNRRVKFVYMKNQLPTAVPRLPTEMTSLMTSVLASLPVITIHVHRAPTVTSLHTSHLQRHRVLTSTTSARVQRALFAVACVLLSSRHDLTVTSPLPTTNHGAVSPARLVMMASTHLYSVTVT